MSSRRVQFRSSVTARRKAPQRVDEFELVIRDLASDGRGVGEAPDGQVVFVGSAWVSERVYVRRTRQGAQTSTQLINVIDACEERVEPVCPHHFENQCGGCPWMFVSYEAQLSAKADRLRASLESLNATQIVPIVHPSPRQWGYRNRAQLKTNGKALGYLAANSHNIADVGVCPILTEPNQAQLMELREELPNNKWRPKARQKWVTLDIDDQRSSALVNQRQPFRQANDEQNATMSRWLGRTLESLSSPDGLLELFCGSGNLTSVLAGSFPDHQITAVEGDEDALEALLSLELPNVRTQRRNLFSARDIETLAATLSGSQGIVLDPPRDGLKERDAFTSIFSKSPWVVYISCNLATWQRDAHFLREHGLVLTQVEGLDMFPQTPHLEVLSVFERK